MSGTLSTNAKRMAIAGWVVTGLIGAFLVFSASLKFVAPGIVRETMAGLGWPAEHDLTIGIIEAVAVALFLFPRTAVLGALLETAILGGAIATHLRVGSPMFSHTLFGVYMGVMVWGGIWLRDPRVRALLPLR